jgi:hypothetical protein
MAEIRPAEIHPNLANVSALIGTWTGKGEGVYPTIEPFRYFESLTLSDVGKPFLVYRQRTRSVADDGTPGEPLHAEDGFWRFPGSTRAELLISQPTGINEISEGTLAATADGHLVIDVASTSVGLSSTAKSVVAIERTFRLEGDALSYDVRMAAVGEPLQHHLSARLSRTSIP